MDDYFCKNIISLLVRSDIKFLETDLRPVKFQEEGTSVNMLCAEVLNIGPTPLSKTPAISCLIVFTLFDAHLENKYGIEPGTTFKKRYEALPSASNQNIIEKECYRLMKTIRNGFVHNINTVFTENNLFHFNYVSPQKTTFNLLITSDKLELLYSIILLLVKEEYEVNTKGHFENIICTYYNKLKTYVDTEGYFTDDGDIGTGTLKSFSLPPVSSNLKFNTIVRYPVLNPTYSISDGKIKINSIYNPGYADYSTDYKVIYKDKEYFIPQEILDENNSLNLSDISIWENNSPFF